MARSIALFLEWSWLLVSNGKWWTEIRTYMHVGSSELMIYRNRCSRVFSVLESTYWASCWSGKHHQWHISWLSVPSLAYKQSWQLHCSAIHYPIWWVQKWGSNACIMHVCDLGKEKCVCVRVCFGKNLRDLTTLGIWWCDTGILVCSRNRHYSFRCWIFLIHHIKAVVVVVYEDWISKIYSGFIKSIRDITDCGWVRRRER